VTTLLSADPKGPRAHLSRSFVLRRPRDPDLIRRRTGPDFFTESAGSAADLFTESAGSAADLAHRRLDRSDGVAHRGPRDWRALHPPRALRNDGPRDHEDQASRHRLARLRGPRVRPRRDRQRARPPLRPHRSRRCGPGSPKSSSSLRGRKAAFDQLTLGDSALQLDGARSVLPRWLVTPKFPESSSKNQVARREIRVSLSHVPPPAPGSLPDRVR